VTGLRRDYERIALSGAKRIHDDPANDVLDGDQAAALTRLAAADLAVVVGDAFTLLQGEDANVSLDDSTLELMRVLYSYWLRSDDEASDDEVLYGEVGYWQHWWNMLRARPDRAEHPLEVDMLIADSSAFTDRDWLDGLDDEILAYVRDQKLVTGRVIVPPSTLDAPAESLVEWAIELGLSVRVFRSSSQYVVYDAVAAVLHDDTVEGEMERHRLTRRGAVVEPLRQLYSLQWAAAIPWEEYSKDAAGVLHLLAQGWTDVRIADAMGVSPRTVSRRVSEAMNSAGVQSRFELGIKYALSELGTETP